MTSKDRHSVILIHGIRTRAEWQETVARVLESQSHIKAVPAKYEFFDVIRFILPINLFRKKPIDRITKIIRDEKEHGGKISVIAHSFGSYIICKILENCGDIHFHRIILCGGIVRDDYPWDLVKGRIDKGDSESYKILNDCGMKDILPVLAKSTSWGYGSSGRFGFGSNRVKDRYHALGHSDFFTAQFAQDYWLPFIIDGTIKKGDIPSSTTSWWVSILTIVQPKYLIFICLLLAWLVYADIIPLPWISELTLEGWLKT
ncbi:MAG: hypothetical protein ACI9SP_002022 [Arenicella sp.]|jgi:hypothetical protein